MFALFLFITFLGMSALLWLSVYGYFLVLWIIAHARRDPYREITSFPEIAVLIPTLNEEKFILPKLENLKSSDYPRHRMTILVVDGGSIDRTTQIVEKEIERSQKIRLIRVKESRGKLDQIRHALDQTDQDIIVINDADSTLEKSCITELVRLLILEPDTALVGATIRPDSALMEERIHWWLLNGIWWLEGRALAAASISGVCHAFRLDKVFLPDQDVRAEDIHLALTASNRGNPVRTCRRAQALETRVPQTIKDFVEFRRRRGGGYVSELRQIKPDKNTPTGYRVARLMHLWHFRAVPKLAVGVILLSLFLLFTPYKIWLIPVFLGLVAPTLTLLFASPIGSGEKHRWLRLSWSACRMLVLSLYSMLILYFHPKKQGAVGGRS
jgi:cellulose synthase/poly-beta-1,6-N-acetylglucosamine synthase-like glycosyltransferase